MELVMQLSAAAAVLALLGLVLWALRRGGAVRFTAPGFGARNAKRRLEVVESRALGGGHAIHLLRVADRALVIAIHPGGCTVVDQRAWPEMAGAGEGTR